MVQHGPQHTNGMQQQLQGCLCLPSLVTVSSSSGGSVITASSSSTSTRILAGCG